MGTFTKNVFASVPVGKSLMNKSGILSMIRTLCCIHHTQRLRKSTRNKTTNLNIGDREISVVKLEPIKSNNNSDSLSEFGACFHKFQACIIIGT
jgi:hypothetical protein